VAASIAGIVSILTVGLFSVYSGKKAESTITPLVRKQLNDVQKQINRVEDKLNKSTSASLPLKPKFEANFNATGFLIDGNGYIATNAHVINKAKNLIVENKNGDQYYAEAVYVNKQRDLAILKIKDTSFHKMSVPYTIRKGGSKLGEQIFTLGYPREVVVYGEGYLSAKIGPSGDTSSYQVSISVNPGNSGGPVLNKYGEVIGIISAKETNADGVVYAISSKNIYNALDEIRKKDSIRLPSARLLRGLDREQQIEKIEDCVFVVKGN
ncbi:MAG: trypsin-like peptidase domain-containing protein, partial [Chitinophagaceae bacterium]